MKVSVIIPTYNYAQYIPIAIKSVLDQITKDIDIELIIVDDGSTDKTDLVVRDLKVTNLKYIKQIQSGKANATKVGILQTTGKYIFNLDADDFFLPGKIKKTVEIFEMNPGVVHVATPALCINEQANSKCIESVPSSLFKINNGTDTLSFFYRNNILLGGGSTFSARADILRSIKISNEIDMYIDEYLVLAALSYGQTYFFPQPLSVWRSHDKNYSGSHDKNRLKEKRQRLFKSSLGVLNNLKELPLPKSVVSIYKLQHRVREMVLKEELNEKSLGDILGFFLFILCSGYSVKVLKNYSAFKRLIPSRLLFFLKATINNKY